MGLDFLSGALNFFVESILLVFVELGSVQISSLNKYKEEAKKIRAMNTFKYEFKTIFQS